MSNKEFEETKQCVLFMCSVTLKTIILVMVFGYGLLYAVLNTAQAADLRAETIIDSSSVHVSDIFSDVPSTKNVVLGNAPQPGQTIILNAKTLQRIANMYDIDWKSQSNADQIILQRSSQTINADAMLEALKKDLQAKGLGGEFGVSISNVAPLITLPGDAPATVEVSQISYTPGRDVFTAVLAAPSAANPIKTLSVSGLIEKMKDIPVLRTSLKNGDIIGSSDIEWVSVAERRMLHDTVIDADHLIGRTPIRAVDANMPVRTRDIISPQLIARGDEVLIQFVSNGMSLSARGKAMQNGAEGERIRVLNLSSNQSLQAEITGDKVVKVQ
ncbi:MAG: flagellar basal body P-ring formation chaperone FlgA [Pseudomonadota bacterium]